MLEIITDHEQAMREACRKPLSWPPHNACNNNCTQGRACDCVADIGDEPREPMRREDAALAVVLILASWGVVAAVLVMVGVHF